MSLYKWLISRFSLYRWQEEYAHTLKERVECLFKINADLNHQLSTANEFIKHSFDVELLKNCSICEAEDISIFASNKLRNGVVHPVYKCNFCDHKFVNPLPNADQVKSFYQGQRYFDRDRSYQDIHSLIIDEQWADFVHGREKILNKVILSTATLARKVPLNILEVGCLEGALLKSLAIKGHKVSGIEVNKEVVEATNKINNLNIFNCDIEEGIFSWINEFDVILSFHTFEHLRNPFKSLSKCIKMLKPGGFIILEVPFEDDELNNPDHLHFFSKRSLQIMLNKELRSVQIFENNYRRDGKYLLSSYYGVGQKYS